MLRLWQKSGTNVDDALTLLKLDDHVGNHFERPEWKTWADCVAMLNTNDVDGSIVSALTRKFNLDGLSLVLAAAIKIPSTKDVATRLQDDQLKRWLRYNMSPDTNSSC